MTLSNAWEKEKETHLGDYGDSSEYDLECAFKAGWEASYRHYKKRFKAEMSQFIDYNC